MASRRTGGQAGGRVAAAALLLSAALAGCNVGDAVPRCTLDPAELQVTTNACQGIGVALISGTAFSYGDCGVACPRPWTITIRWTNRTTGATGEQQLGWHTSSCWPFSATSCGPDPFSVGVPVTAGADEIELAADEGDGYTACQVVLAPGC